EAQADLFSAGISGTRPRVPTDPSQLEAAARKALPEEAFAYIAGGAGAGRTVVANREAFARWQIWPRVLKDVSARDLSTTLLARAEASGCTAIVVTLDTHLLGWRTQDLDLGYLPFVRGLGIAQYTTDPVFKELVARRARNQPGDGSAGRSVRITRKAVAAGVT